MPETDLKAAYPATLEELAGIVAATMTEAGIDPVLAANVAGVAIERVRAVFGGELLYIPMGLGYNLARRNAEIRRRLAAGESRVALRRAFGLSEMQLRRIEDDDTPSRR